MSETKEPRYSVRVLGGTSWSDTDDSRQALADWSEALDVFGPSAVVIIDNQADEIVTDELLFGEIDG